MDKQEWRLDALCKTLSPKQADAMFFFGPGKSSKRAKEFCANCPVNQECTDFSILYDEVGVWGGKTDAERMALKPLLQTNLRHRAIMNGTLESRNMADFMPPARPLFDLQEFLELLAG